MYWNKPFAKGLFLGLFADIVPVMNMVAPSTGISARHPGNISEEENVKYEVSINNNPVICNAYERFFDFNLSSFWFKITGIEAPANSWKILNGKL